LPLSSKHMIVSPRFTQYALGIGDVSLTCAGRCGGLRGAGVGVGAGAMGADAIRLSSLGDAPSFSSSMRGLARAWGWGSSAGRRSARRSAAATTLVFCPAIACRARRGGKSFR